METRLTEEVFMGITTFVATYTVPLVTQSGGGQGPILNMSELPAEAVATSTCDMFERVPVGKIDERSKLENEILKKLKSKELAYIPKKLPASIKASSLCAVDHHTGLEVKIVPNFKKTYEECYSPKIYSCIFSNIPGTNNSLASLLYLLDPTVHLLFFDHGGDISEFDSMVVEPPQGLAILIEAENEYGEKYLIVEGVLANKSFNELVPLSSVNGIVHSRVYYFVNECIEEYARELGMIAFTSTYQVQSTSEVGPIEYLEYLSKLYKFKFKRGRRTRKRSIRETKEPKTKWIISDNKTLDTHDSVYFVKDDALLKEKLSDAGLDWNEEHFTQAFARASDEPWGEDGCWGKCKGEVRGLNLSQFIRRS